MSKPAETRRTYRLRRTGHTIGQMNSGWAFLHKIALILIMPAITSQLWMARTIFILDERMVTVSGHIQEQKILITNLSERVLKLEFAIKP